MAGAIYCALLHAGVCLLHCLYSCSYRRKLRAAYGLPAEPCADGCVHCFCEPCALSQMYRELKNRGADPADGKRMGLYIFIHLIPPTSIEKSFCPSSNLPFVPVLELGHRSRD